MDYFIARIVFIIGVLVGIGVLAFHLFGPDTGAKSEGD